MGIDVKTLAATKKYTEQSITGSGALKGEKGDPGKDGITPHIGNNGNWYIGDYDTNVKVNGSDGNDGFTPSITENTSNKADYYRLDIKNKDKTFTTPNLMGVIGMEYKNKSVGTPVGEIISYMGTIVPTNYLICNGTVYQIADYPYLSQHFLDNFGAVNFFGGDGETTFAVPDLRGEFLRGYGANGHIDQGNGADVGKHQNATITIGIGYDGNRNLSIHGAPIGQLGTIGVENNADTVITTNTAGAYWSKTNTFNYNGEVAYTSRPTNTSVLYCIKYQPTYWITPTNNTDEE